MKQYRLNICILFVCISATFLLLPSKSYGQLNGSYTINPKQSASNTNYQNWASAIGDLISGSRSDGGNAQGSGVNGPVIITVYDTVYANTQVAITPISGASYSNTITFRSAKGDSSKCVLQYPSSSTSTTDDYVCFLNGADYITFRGIGFERTGTADNCTVVNIGNDADNNRFIRCLMKGKKMQSTSGLGFNYLIGTCVFFSGNADSTQLTGNRLLYGYNGVYNANACTANTYTGNTCDTNGASGIYTTQQTSLRIIGNTFNMGDFGAGSGHYVSYGARVESSPGLLIAGNKISMTAVNSSVCRALVIASNGNSGTGALPLMIYNNSIYVSGGSTSGCTGLAVYNSFFMNFFSNNVLINSSISEGAAYYQYYGAYTNSNLNLVNNNLINKGAGYAIDVRDGTNYANIDSFQNNNMYSAGTYLAYWNTTKYSSLSSFQSGSGKGANSLSLDPGFISNSDLHVSSIGINGKAMPYPKIQYDIDNEMRDATKPDIGSDEFFPITLDAGISSIDSPSLFCAGKQAVKVRFQNYGIDTIKSIKVGWTVNGTAQTAGTWTGVLAPGGTSSPINLGLFSFSGNTAYAFKVWSTSPNNGTDGKKINDTLKITKYAAMSGTYTIGDTNNANYKSFNQAITAMTDRGVCGAVTFNVYNGVYNEQLGISQLPGMGLSSPVLFQSISKDSSKVKVILASTTANGSNNAVVQLRGADYTTFKGVTFERTGTNIYAHVVHILAGATHNTFTNCRMVGLPLTSASANAINIWSDQGGDDYNTFRNNYIKNGSYSFQYAGASSSTHEKGTVIEGNVMEGAYKNTIHIRYNDSVVVKGNTFLNVVVADTASSDIQLIDCDKAISVTGNYFKNGYSENAILLNGCAGTASAPGTIANNSIVKVSGTGLQVNKGIALIGVDYQNVVFNSIYFTGSTTGNAGIHSTAATSTNIVIRNNNIVMEEGETVHITTNSQVSASDRNNFYGKGIQFAFWGGSTYPNLPSLSSSTGKDKNSFSEDPMFKSATDLHIVNPKFKGAASPVASVTTDIDGDIRNPVTPDIGADEFKPLPNDAGIIGLTKPVANTCTGLLDVEVVIMNFGSDTLKTATIDWSVSGVSQTPFSWTGKLASFTTDTVMIGVYNFKGNSSPLFIVKTVLPNGKADGISFNDELFIVRSLNAPLSPRGGPNRTICPGDTAFLGLAQLNLQYKWTTLSQALIDTTAKITVKPTVTTSYILKISNGIPDCDNTDTVVVDVNTKPLVDAGKDRNKCERDTVVLGASPQGGYNYSWTSQFSSTVFSTQADPKVFPSVTTAYYLQKTSAGAGCMAMDTVVITVIPYPVPQISGKDSACNGNKFNYTTPAHGSNTFFWNISGGQIQSGQGTRTINIMWNQVGKGTLIVTETNTTGCKGYSFDTVTVSPNPVAGFSVTGGTCKGSSTVFSNTSTGAQGYAWTFGDAGTSTQTAPTHLYAATGTFTIRLFAVTSAGCFDSITKQVTINPVPVVNFLSTKVAEKTYHFTDGSTIPSGTITSWQWLFDDGDSSAIQDPNHQYANAGNYNVRLCVTSAAGCKTCDTRSMTVLGIFEPSFSNSLYAVPNPGTGVFAITSTVVMDRVVVTDVLGQVIYSMDPDGNNFKIDLTAQPAGIYFVKVGLGNRSGIIKLVKQ